MKKQHQVILSIGTNQGNRLENIERCIKGLHKEIGTVIRVSKLYETPSWGFESEKFYNCAVILNTHKSAHLILEEVLLLEEALGRVRDTNIEGYQARVIDIDVIAFDEEIIASEKLQVPHPEMQNRLFVLLPMRDLDLDWRHPILQKYLHELLVLSEDKSNCKVIQNLEIPIAKIKLDHFNYIAIEGNIGAGKTTLTNKLAEDFNAKTVL
jgi:2-amino-4-hydroxy-6-hydroxymethyldihydropteridine diphosphokinase